jgi:hypothetical protein
VGADTYFKILVTNNALWRVSYRLYMTYALMEFLFCLDRSKNHNKNHFVKRTIMQEHGICRIKKLRIKNNSLETREESMIRNQYG